MEIYLLKGSSYRLLNSEISKITRDIENITTFSLVDVNIRDILDDASYYGLFPEKRCLIIKDTKYFGGKFAYEEESNLLYDFLSSKLEDLIMIFLCDDIKKTKDLTKKVVAIGAKIIDMSNISEDSMKELITNYCNEQAIKLDSQSYSQILKNSANNLDIMIQEIDKLSLVDKHITTDIVNTYGSKEPDDETFNFSNAVVAKQFKTAFDLLDILLKNGVEPSALIGLLSSSFSNMYMVRDAVNHQLSDEEIAKALGYSGTGRVYVMKKNSKIYTLEQLKEIMLDLCALDIKIKTGYNPVYGIKEFLLNL